MLGTTSERLYFEKLFRVSVQYIHTVGESELRERGQHVSRNKHVDKDIANVMTTTFLSCEQMFGFYLKGSRITAINDKVASDIYKTIGSYLSDWRQYSLTSLGARIPYENLIALDNFAEGCFNTAVNELKLETPAPTGMQAFMAQLNERLGHGDTKPTDRKIERENFAQFFRDGFERSPLLRNSYSGY